MDNVGGCARSPEGLGRKSRKPEIGPVEEAIVRKGWGIIERQYRKREGSKRR